MRTTRRAMAGILSAFLLAVPVSGVTAPSAAPTRPAAVLDATLSDRMASAKATTRLETIVTGWDRDALGVLDRMGVTHRKLTALPMAFAKLTPAQIARVAAAKDIRSVYGQRAYKIYLQESARLIGARHVADRMKIDGKGSTIAVIDTGIDTGHPALPLGTKVLNNYEVVSPNVFDPGAPLLVESPNTDDNEHGTHVAGTVAGNGAGAQPGQDHRGIAPGASIIGYSANQGPSLLTTHTVAAFDHIIANVRRTKVRAISNSWGGADGFDHEADSPVSVAQEAAWRAGIVPVFAAGNSGNPGDVTGDGLNTLSQQCVSPYAVCVAAMTKHRQVVTFSSKGRPAANWDRAAAQRFRIGMYRPTVAAPGVNIVAPAALVAAADADQPYGYVSFSGTSMATPEVSGVIALMTSANPKLTPAQITRILEATAQPMPGWDAHEEGAGAVDARRAVEAALAMKRGGARLSAPVLDYARPAVASKVIAKVTGSALPLSWNHKHALEAKSFTVPAGVERLDIDLDWTVEGENLYGYLFGPGQTPNLADPTGPPFAHQETWGLLCDAAVSSGPCVLDGRKLSVRYPKAGTWRLAVYGRTATLLSYEATVRAATIRVPTATAKLAGGVLSGTASFPTPNASLRSFRELDGTDTAANPLLKPVKMFFHGEGAVGNLDTYGGSAPTWNTTAPTGGEPKATHGTFLADHTNPNGGIAIARFEGRTPRAIQGDVDLEFWAGATLQGVFGAEWNVALISGKKVFEGLGTTFSISEAPTRIPVTVPNVTLPANAPLIVQIRARFVNSGTHYAVYYDSTTTPSGMTLPTVSKIVTLPVGTARVADAAVTVQPDGRLLVSWPLNTSARSYRIYAGSSPDALRPMATVAQPRSARAPLGALKVTGTIAQGHPGTSVSGVTETEYVWMNGCDGEPSFQGLDGYAFDVPATARGQKMTVSGPKDGSHDLDVHFFDADCVAIDNTSMSTPAQNETGTVPADAAHVVVVEFNGVSTDFAATLGRALSTDGRVTKTLGGFTNRTPAYVRVAAIDAKGREGVKGDLLVARPAAFDRVVEVSVGGGPWTAVPVRLARDGRSGTWSVPLASLPRGTNGTAVAVRARAAEAAGPAVTVKAAGAFRPAVKGAADLPATGLADGVAGLALAGLAAALAVRARRRTA